MRKNWPKHDESALKTNEIEIVIQINGKVKGKLVVAAGLSKDELEKIVMSDKATQKLTDGKEIVKIVPIPEKLVNIVVKN